MSLSAISPTLTACAKQMDHGSGMGTTESPTTTDHGSSGSAESSTAMSHDMGDMDLGPKDETFDLRFIDGMILHHQGAVAMAEDALEHSNRDEIRQLAQAIAAVQQTEIEQMQQWRQAWYPDAGPEPMMYHAQMGHMMEMSEEMKAAMMMNVDLGAADEEFDLRFLNAMIPHHEGALEMAEQALERSDRPEMQELARNILSSQQQEIDQMNQWKKDWYGQ
ncbi:MULTISPECIES: DUF305 domain-containing protein [unclassified Leptolyngbya]|uniref:DUF305 domain-containing protein n=1 Tax=unclassified Leptolyngbya TaxID=2650499 RepID=UPI001F553F1C|nr:MULTISPECIES: DUF305 domain-containing protein [unclassified Leptolyngbya]